ncbi:MAG: hotdog fold thioesterase [Deltaproteobacteria bacterium]|nr:hotdog fold thioesterase [Deltaproteobacteria bacterium]
MGEQLPETEEMLQRLSAAFSGLVPHNTALGIVLAGFDRSGVAEMRLAWREDLVGNPETEVLHGGVITSLLDACCGAAVFIKKWSADPIATLDLRIDYLKPARPRQSVTAKATCYKLTTNVAFVRAIAYHDDETDPIASAAGTFMLGTRGAFAKVEGARP